MNWAPFRYYAPLVVAVILIIVAYFAGVKDATNKIHAQLELEKAVVEQQVKAESERRVNEAERMAHDATEKLKKIESSYSRASATADGLRKQLQGIKLRSVNATACSSTTGTTTRMLTDMLGECSERYAKVAEYADRSRVVGEYCVNQYNMVRNK